MTFEEEKKAIQAAWAAGKRSVVLDGVKFTLQRQDHEPIVQVGGARNVKEKPLVEPTQIKVKESWIVAKPADGSLLPVFNVEIRASANLRSKLVAAGS